MVCKSRDTNKNDKRETILLVTHTLTVMPEVECGQNCIQSFLWRPTEAAHFNHKNQQFQTGKPTFAIMSYWPENVCLCSSRPIKINRKKKTKLEKETERRKRMISMCVWHRFESQNFQSGSKNVDCFYSIIFSVPPKMLIFFFTSFFSSLHLRHWEAESEWKEAWQLWQDGPIYVYECNQMKNHTNATKCYKWKQHTHTNAKYVSWENDFRFGCVTSSFSKTKFKSTRKSLASALLLIHF